MSTGWRKKTKNSVALGSSTVPNRSGTWVLQTTESCQPRSEDAAEKSRAERAVDQGKPRLRRSVLPTRRPDRALPQATWWLLTPCPVHLGGEWGTAVSRAPSGYSQMCRGKEGRDVPMSLTPVLSWTCLCDTKARILDGDRCEQCLENRHAFQGTN